MDLFVVKIGIVGVICTLFGIISLIQRRVPRDFAYPESESVLSDVAKRGKNMSSGESQSSDVGLVWHLVEKLLIVVGFFSAGWTFFHEYSLGGVSRIVVVWVLITSILVFLALRDVYMWYRKEST